MLGINSNINSLVAQQNLDRLAKRPVASHHASVVG